MGLREGSPLFALLFAVTCLSFGSCGEARPTSEHLQAAPPRISSHIEASRYTLAASTAEPAEARVAAARALVEGPEAPSPMHDALHHGVSWLVEQAIARGELPGCVIAVGSHEGVQYLQAFGERTAGERMTVDTRFDLASLTKPVATAASVMSLAERGAIDVEAQVSRYLPEFALPDKRGITVQNLLMHTSGLRKVSVLGEFEHGREQALRNIAAARLVHPRGAVFGYSDLGFVVLGELVARVSGERLDQYAEKAVFAPLGMRDTRFLPKASEVALTAPTEEREGHVIRGVVDDPRAYRLGGVAGHAGLFSTARDLSRFAQMLLQKGELDGTRVLAAETVEHFIAPKKAGDTMRALGWDVASTYALGRGRTMSEKSFGHGGYTGTSLWVDPEQDLFVVLLSNRVHVRSRGSIHPLTSSVADLAVAARRGPESAAIRTGIDVLEAEGFARLRGRQVAVLTHGAARDSKGVRTLDRLLYAPEVYVRAVLAPEHGLNADREGHLDNGKVGQVPLYSLFGKKRKPDASMLKGVDTLVIDLVDVGTRFYTYMSTVLASLEAASELGIEVVLLDRPNPIDGVHVEGPISQTAYQSFVNYHPLPLRHGMTAGELARWLAQERKLPVKLHVVKTEHWRRELWAGETELAWVPPSPNLRTTEQAMLYPAIGLVEGTNVSVGRGGERAFTVVGAPFIKGEQLAQELAREALPGIEVSATSFRPKVGPHSGLRVEGVSFTLRDAKTFSAARTGLSLIRALARLYPAEWDQTRLEKMVAHEGTMKQLAGTATAAEIERSWSAELEAFAASRKRVLLY
jgi:uncharacterized protein YbbC (DUF1343 family)